MDKTALHKLSYGIYVLTTKAAWIPYGCIVNTAFQITAEPARIAVSCNRDNFTHDKIKDAGIFAVSVLAEDSDAEIIKTFGYSSGRNTDKFAKIQAAESRVLSLPVFPVDSVAVLECRLEKTVEVGTHTLFIGTVEDCVSSRPDAREMTYRFYHEIRKGRAPKNAPSYIDEEETPAATPMDTTAAESGEKWRCSVCGYVYDKANPAFAELPAGWKCPVCGAAKNAFNKSG